MKNLPDEILIEKLQEGDEKAFQVIYDRYWQRLYQLCFYYTAAREEAEDIVAELFLSLWNNRGRLQIDNLQHYLLRAAKYKSLKFIDRQQRKFRKVYSLLQKGDDLYVEESSPGSVLEIKELSTQIQQSLRELPQKTKKIFLLNRESGFTYDEIAGQMGVSVKTIEYHVSKALKSLGKYLQVLLPALLLCATAYGQRKPNIIFILADDLGYGDLGSYGQRMIKTPHLDTLAAQGMRFTNYYAGCSVCAPSRETLLTGKHTGHTYIRGNFLTDAKEDPPLPDTAMTVAEWLKRAGYHTALIGKWGLGGETHGPEKQGFDHTYGYLDQIHAHNYYPTYLYEDGRKFMIDENKDSARKVLSEDLFISRTLEYLNRADSKNPLFLYLPYTFPHGEYNLPPDTPYSNTDWPRQFKVYATMVTRLDAYVGSILTALKKNGLADNTLIFFTSDNGANMGFAKFFNSNGNLTGSKFGLYEGGIRAPMIAWWPGKIRAGQVSRRITASWDLLPTICNAAGAATPRGIDGISILPLLEGKGEPPAHEYLYWEYYSYNYNWDKPGATLPRNWLESIALRMGKWKVMKKNMYQDKTAAPELYDLDADPGEKSNVAAEHPDIIKKAEGILTTCSEANTPWFPYKPSPAPSHRIVVHNFAELKDLFHYSPDRVPFISSHRGGPLKGFPENCTATFENTLQHSWSMMEMDPHYTKDSQLVVMHDPTLDRTSDGHGRISSYTLAELKKVRLKDPEGNVTQYGIQTLDEMLEWAKGKTILVIDMKEVPIEARVKKIEEHHAEANAVVIAYSFEDAQKCYSMDKNIMMEVMMPDKEAVAKFDAMGIPWSNVFAFITHTQPKDTAIFRLVHEKGSLCMIGSSRSVDKEYQAGKISSYPELMEHYKGLIREGADIIEADRGIDAGAAVQSIRPEDSPKEKYFK